MTTDLAVIDQPDTTGLEDMTTADQVMPRLKIFGGGEGAPPMWQDSLSGEEWADLTVIMLGVVKQRILWDSEVDDDAMPLCKSFDHEVGFADPKVFPWASAYFDPTKFDPAAPVLPCDACNLKEWGTNPKDNKTPWCSEQFTVPVLVEVAPNIWAPSIWTIQRSSISAAKKYISSFTRAGMPLYTAFTKLTLEPHKRGKVYYATPIFKKVGATDIVDHEGYAAQYRAIRAFVSTPRGRSEEEGVATQPATPATSTPGSPLSDMDEVPF